MRLRVLSLGAGVQSSTLLLMACWGEEPLDLAIFADTLWEPAAVYTHLTWLLEQARAAGIPVSWVSKGDLRQEALAAETRFASLPLHIRNLDGRGGMLRRQCTREYKIQPIRTEIRAQLETRSVKAVDLLMGISLDEWTRMRDSDVRYIRNVYPLIDRRMTRADCLRWLAAHGYPEPPKSACIGCPFHDNAYWRNMRDHRPEEWADAIAFDAAVRHGKTRIIGEAFVHRSLVPLAQVDLSTPQDHGQLDLFAEECAGVCGV